MVIGIPEFRDPAQCATLTGMLALPFRNEAGNSGRSEKPAP